MIECILVERNEEGKYEYVMKERGVCVCVCERERERERERRKGKKRELEGVN